MSEAIQKKTSSLAVSEWLHRGLGNGQALFEGCVGFLKKGAKKQSTMLRLKEFKAERLKQVPNYVVLAAARKHLLLGLEAVLTLSLLCNVFFGYQMVNLCDRLSQKRITLVPSRLDQTMEVDIGRISERQVHSTFVMYLSLLGTVDATNIDENYRILKEFMSPELRVQFERDTRDYRRMIRNEGLSEQVLVSAKKVTIAKDGQIFAEAIVRVRPSIGTTIGKVRDEKITMRMRVIANYEQNQWLIQVLNLNRTPVESAKVSEKGD